MLDIDIKPRADHRLDIYVADGGNHEPLINTSQGYENHGHAVELAERLFGPDPRIQMIRNALADALDHDTGRDELITTIRAALDSDDSPEPAYLTTHWRNGDTSTRQLR